MGVKLNVHERLVLLSILPKEGNISAIRVLHELKQELSFSEDEHLRLEFQNRQDGTTAWRKEADKPKDIHVGLKAEELIKDTLTGLDSSKKLSESHLVLWDIFMEGNLEKK